MVGASTTRSMSSSHQDSPVSRQTSSGPGESVIRKMTRLALEYGAVNLSQGFPNEPPPLEVRAALAHAVLTGTATSVGSAGEKTSLELLKRAVEGLSGNEGNGENTVDVLNQYSPPMGRPDLRQAIANHYERIYGYSLDGDTRVTVTLGATEAVASALRTVAKPGDRVVVFEPYHELYPSQAKIWFLEASFVTLMEDHEKGTWTFDQEALAEALEGARVLLLNSPHNPTGKVFTREELRLIADLCIEHDVILITDEIYEHMVYASGKEHLILPKEFPELADRTLMCNSIGKSASATGWRVGWCITPPHLTDAYRGIHDQLVVMAPHPMQYSCLTYLSLDESYFRETLATRYLDRIGRLVASLRKAGFDAGRIPVEGAYYVFCNYKGVSQLVDLTAWDATMFLVREVGVACVPGTNFYGSGCPQAENYLRFAACRSEADIDEACRRIQEKLTPL